jgi:hypothetical protein
LESTTGLESELESMKDANDKKLDNLETKLSELTKEITSLRAEGNQDLKESLKARLNYFPPNIVLALAASDSGTRYVFYRHPNYPPSKCRHPHYIPT